MDLSILRSKPHLPLGMRNFYTMGAKYLILDILLFRYPVFVSPFRVRNNAIREAMLSCFILFYFISSLTVLFARLYPCLAKVPPQRKQHSKWYEE